MMRRLLSVKEVSKILDCTEQTVRRLIISGKLRASKPFRHLKIEPSAIDAFIKATQVVPPPPPRARGGRRVKVVRNYVREMMGLD